MSHREQDHVIDLHQRRQDVIRRLLDHGLSAPVLGALLPDWAPLIRQVAGAPDRCQGRTTHQDPGAS